MMDFHPRLLAVLLAISACERGEASADIPHVGTEQSTTLALAAAETPGGIAVDIAYARQASSEAPRMAELLIDVDGPVAHERSERLDAAARAGKDVVVLPRDDGSLRVLVFTTQNLTRLDSGPLARLHLRRTGPGPVRFELVGQPTIFAPPEANTAVTLGPAVSLP